ncbi:MAG TPA: PQQ-binding-like beta-propeller repeat protein [Verrucomicrobiota bacterium]|nr:PQQ-binding-like beta-propeller repeat protein [Verrucomicrobiota bacterium]
MTPNHPVPYSGTPVIDLAGVVYVGSANGYLYCFNAATGQRLWRVKLNASGLATQGEPIEATPAIGENGWVYVSTRYCPVGAQTSVTHAYAINPLTATANVDHAVEKIAWTSAALASQEPGTIGGLVVDACGVVYVTDFWGDRLYLLDGLTGAPLGQQATAGKPCQAPALNRNGMLYLGLSKDMDGGGGGQRTIQGLKVSPGINISQHWTATGWTAAGGQSGEFGDFFGGVLLRADGSGTTYLADANPDDDTGRVYRFTSGAPSMAGDSPTLGGGNRRQHKARTYPYQMVELGAFPQGDAGYQAVHSVDALGRAVGYAHGKPGYPYYGDPPLDWYGAYWTSASPVFFGNFSYPEARLWMRTGNLAGHVVGYRYSGPIVLPYGLTSPSSTYALALALPPGHGGGEARDINAASSIVGFSFTAGKPTVVRWDLNGTVWEALAMGTPGSGGQAYAFGLSNNRRVCGKARFTVGGPWLGYTSPEQVDDLTTTESLGSFGGLESEAFEVHDLGGTAGWAHKRIGTSDYRRAFLVPPDGSMLSSSHEVPGFAGQLSNGLWQSESWAVNGCRQVVGRAQNAGGSYRAFFWQPGDATLRDLTALAPAGWTLGSAIGISDAGHIVGSGTKTVGQSQVTRQWLMFPQPQE